MQLSILIPVFNAGEFLLPLLESIRAIESSTLEIVAVDDGSTDQSATVLTNAAVLDPRLRVLTQNNAGVAMARNRCLQEARGEYVWFVDSDDLISSDKIEALLSASANMLDVVTFNGERIEVGAPSVNIYRLPKAQGEIDGEAWLNQLLSQRELRHFAWLHWCRRQYLSEIGLTFLPGIAHEDVAWVTEVTLRAPKLRYVDVLAYRYRVHPSSTTGNASEASLMHRIRSYFTVIEQLRAINQSVPMRTDTLRRLRGEVVGQALQIFELRAMLVTPENRRWVVTECRARKFAASLWPDALNLKRRRQVLAMWWHQLFG